MSQVPAYKLAWVDTLSFPSPFPPSAHQQPTPTRPISKDARLSVCETRPRGRRPTRTVSSRAHTLLESLCPTRMEGYVPRRACGVDQRGQGRDLLNTAPASIAENSSPVSHHITPQLLSCPDL